jgi:predicted Zn finger-like uncharacterized protein
MIIQCEQCQAKFRLDDSKVTDRGVKVRCAKCKHVFTVTREQPAAESLDFGSSLVQAPAPPPEEASFPAPPPLQPQAEEPASEFQFDTDSPKESADSTFRMESPPFDTSVSDSAFATPGSDEFSLSSLESDEGFAVERDASLSAHGEVDFGGFDFGDSGGGDADKTMIAPPASADLGDETMIQQPRPPAPPVIEVSQGPGFSDDDIFGAAALPPATAPVDSNSFDFGTGSFTDSVDIGGAEAEQKGSSPSPDSASDASFGLGGLGGIDLGDEPASVPAQQVEPDELKPSPEIPSPAPVVTQEKPEPVVDNDLEKTPPPDVKEAAQDDLPPLTITSRRKQSSLFVGLLAALALLVVGVIGYLGFSSFSDDKEKVAEVAGKISVRAVKASYVNNAILGPLLVISGEAVNEYPKPRAALQVKGMIFDAKGQTLVSKSAFAGNLLTDEQLATLPLDKIEAAMANQFGDSLANLEVASGKKVSFMIVIATPPKEGKDFGVEPTGSTVAAGKQQQ